MNPLELAIDNPYSLGVVTIFDDGDVALDGQDLNITYSNKDRSYQTISGDNLSDISYAAYKSSKWWWAIYQLSDLFNPFELEEMPNKILLVPDLEKIKIL